MQQPITDRLDKPAASPAVPGYSRRGMLQLLAVGPLLASAWLGCFRAGAVVGNEDAGLVIRNGWILRADDLDRLA